MSWTALTAEHVLEEFTPQEQATLKLIQNSQDNLPAIVARSMAEVRGAIESGGYPLGATGTIPDSLHSDAIAIARWRFLIAMPQLKALQTAERKAAYDDARNKLADIAKGKTGVEDPTEPDPGDPPASGCFGSETKINMRTHQE